MSVASRPQDSSPTCSVHSTTLWTPLGDNSVLRPSPRGLGVERRMFFFPQVVVNVIREFCYTLTTLQCEKHAVTCNCDGMLRFSQACKAKLAPCSVQAQHIAHNALHRKLECRHHAPGRTHTPRGGELKVLAAGPNIYEFTIAT